MMGEATKAEKQNSRVPPPFVAALALSFQRRRPPPRPKEGPPVPPAFMDLGLCLGSVLFLRLGRNSSSGVTWMLYLWSPLSSQSCNEFEFLFLQTSTSLLPYINRMRAHKAYLKYCKIAQVSLEERVENVSEYRYYTYQSVYHNIHDLSSSQRE